MKASRWESEEWIFTTATGAFLPLTTWQRKHASICKEARVPLITLHALRHTFATLAMEANVHPKIVSEMLGHASIQTTLDLYSHPSVSLQRTVADDLDERLFGAKKA